MRFTNSIIKTSSLGSLLLLSSNTFAGSPSGNLVYGPGGAHAIPFLNGGMLVVLAAILAVIAYRILKQHKPQQHFLVSVLALAGLTAGMGGIQLINEANAVPAPIELSNPAGGSVPIQNNFNTFTNTSGINQIILSIDVGQQICPGFPGSGPFQEGPECSVGLSLSDQSSCVIACGGEA